MRRAVQDRAELRVAGLLDQAAVEQRGGGRVGADAADAGDLRARDRLQVGDDRERLGLRGAERGDARAAEQPPRRVLGGGVARERPAAAELAQRDARAARARTARRAPRAPRRTASSPASVASASSAGAERVGGEEQQRLDRARERRARPPRATVASDRASLTRADRSPRRPRRSAPRGGAPLLGTGGAPCERAVDGDLAEALLLLPVGLAAFVELEQREQGDGDGHAVGAAHRLVEAEAAAAQQVAQVRQALGDA